MWVATHPATTILASVALCGLFGLGLLNFRQETNMVRLWLPQVKIENLFFNVCRIQILCNTWPGCGSKGRQTQDTGAVQTHKTCLRLTSGITPSY